MTIDLFQNSIIIKDNKEKMPVNSVYTYFYVSHSKLFYVIVYLIFS